MNKNKNLILGENENKFIAKDGLEIFWKKFIPESETKAIVVYAHGILEHQEIYDHFFTELTKAGFFVYAFDARGHGRSGGKRGYVDDFNDFVDDMKMFVSEIVKKEANGKPIFIVSHSMGSLITLSYLETQPEGIQGVVLSGIGSRFNILGITFLSLARFLGKIFKNLFIPIPMVTFFIRGDRELAKNIARNPYTVRRVYAKIGIELYKGLKSAFEKADKINIPIILQYGSKDMLFTKQQSLFDKISSADKTIKRYDRCIHTIYCEVPKKRKVIIEDLIVWINNHI